MEEEEEEEDDREAGAAAGKAGARAETYDEGAGYEVRGAAKLHAWPHVSYWGFDGPSGDSAAQHTTPVSCILAALTHLTLESAVTFTVLMPCPRLRFARSCLHMIWQEAEDAATLDEILSIQLTRQRLEQWHNEVSVGETGRQRRAGEGREGRKGRAGQGRLRRQLCVGEFRVVGV